MLFLVQVYFLIAEERMKTESKTKPQAKIKTLKLKKNTVKDLESRNQQIKGGGAPRPSGCANTNPTYIPTK